MSGSCVLTRERLEALLDGRLDGAAREAVAQHLAEDCDACDALLEGMGLDEETLLLYLAAAQAEPPTEASLDRIYRNIQREERRLEAAQARPQPTKRWSWKWSYGFGGLAVAAAAAVLLVLVTPDGPGTSVGTNVGVKGATSEPPSGAIVLRPEGSDTRRFELRYESDRAADVLIFHWQAEKALPFFQGRLGATSGTPEPIPVEAGTLGYDFTNEPGSHWFVLVLSDTPLEKTEAQTLLEAPRIERSESWVAKRRDGTTARVWVLRHEAEEQAP